MQPAQQGAGRPIGVEPPDLDAVDVPGIVCNQHNKVLAVP